MATAPANDTGLAFHVHTYCPDAAGKELEHREALLKARDFAAAIRGKTVSRAAYDHAVTAHDIAGEYVFADVSEETLANVVKYCRHLVQAAILAEYLDATDGA